MKQRHRDIYSAKICPYCNSNTKIVSEEFIYGRSYKNKSIICCRNFPVCDSFVGTHVNGSPLGRLANKSLRGAKIQAHKFFDILWKDNYLERGEAYEWLSDKLNIPLDYTHIGMFSVETCKNVVKLSQDYISKT